MHELDCCAYMRSAESGALRAIVGLCVCACIEAHVKAVKQYSQIKHRGLNAIVLGFRAGMWVWCQKTHHCYPNLFDMKHTLISLLQYYLYLNNSKTTLWNTENKQHAKWCDVMLLLEFKFKFRNAMMELGILQTNEMKQQFDTLRCFQQSFNPHQIFQPFSPRQCGVCVCARESVIILMDLKCATHLHSQIVSINLLQKQVKLHFHEHSLTHSRTHTHHLYFACVVVLFAKRDNQFSLV